MSVLNWAVVRQQKKIIDKEKVQVALYRLDRETTLTNLLVKTQKEMRNAVFI